MKRRREAGVEISNLKEEKEIRLRGKRSVVYVRHVLHFSLLKIDILHFELRFS